MPITRISETSHQTLRQLAEERRTSIKEVLEAAIEAYHRRCFLEESNKAFAAL